MLFVLVLAVGLFWLSGSSSLMGRVKLSKEFVEDLGETGRWERRWRGSKWP